MKMISFAMVCCLGMIEGVMGISLYRHGAFTPAPPGMRPSCATKGATFCEKVEKYPAKLIQSLLQSKTVSVDDFFTDESRGLDEPPDYILHEDMMELPEKSQQSRKTRSVTKISKSRPESSDLAKRCPVLSKAALPKLAANGAGEWRFIVQDEESKTSQKIRVHMCEKSEECDKYCIQFYAPVPMVSVDVTGNVLKDTFWMPSSCRCHSTPLNDN